MNSRKIENGLAVLGALIILLGVSAAANLALADEAVTADSSLKIEVPTTN